MAEAKYHIGDDGAPSRCVARSAATCPKAKLGDSFHGDLETAQAEAERRFELSYGAFPARTGPVTVALDAKGKETVDFLLANCDPRELISQGRAIKAEDYENFYEALRSLEKKSYAKEITREQLKEGRIALLESLHEKTPSWAIEEMIAYHRGETNDWPVYYNKGTGESSIIATMSRYSDELLEEGAENIERLKTGKGKFTLKAMEGEMLDKVKQDMAAKGFVLEEAIAINPDPEITAEQINYAFANGVDPETGKELLYHGTGSENLLGILNGGFDKSKGTFSAGAANGEGYYFSSDPAVAANFSRIDPDHSGYLVLCEVVTGGPERTQDKAMTVDIYGRKGGSFGKNSPMGKNPDTNLGNLAKKVTLTIKDRLNPGAYDPYEETFVKDSRQIRPVALVKVSGEARDKL